MKTKPARPLTLTLTLLLALAATHPCQAEEEPGFTPMFNGQDLSGWKNINSAPSTWTMQDGLLVCTGIPIGELRTEKMYQNFILELEWRHMKPRGNAGVFVWADDITARGQPFHRGIEVQVLENGYGQGRGHSTHGDIFPIHGAKMTPVNGRGGSRAFPTEERSKPAPEWNHYRITCLDGEISLAVNGKVVTRGTECSPRKGYICLESEGGIVHYRNVRIKELPGNPVPPDHVAIADRGFRCLYSGVDLSGWTAARENDDWKASDWNLRYTGQSDDNTLTTQETFASFGFVIDIRSTASATTEVQLRGTPASAFVINPSDSTISKHWSKEWNRFEGTLEGNKLSLTLNGSELFVDRTLENLPPRGPIRIRPSAPVDLANIYVRQLDSEPPAR